MKKAKRKIAILTGGGDCPGLNAVIRAVAKKAMLEYNMDVIGIKDGYQGLIDNQHEMLSYNDVSGILTLGGTILGTSNTANPYQYAVKKGREITFKDVSKKCISNLKKLGVECLVCIGGDGTLFIANQLCKDGVNVIGVPKTIDNDLRGTDITFGFNTAVSIATDAVDKIHTTAESHHRVMIIEVMGRTAGWIALYAGIAGGGDIILIPEIPYDIDAIIDIVRHRNKRGKRFSIIVISEGTKPKGGNVVIQELVKESTIQVRLGGIGFVLAEQISKKSQIPSRAVVLGHLQRGGSPTAFDRILATRLGTKAVEMIQSRHFGCMVGVKGRELAEVPLEKVAKGPKLVPKNHPLIEAARSVGTSFGD